MMSPTARWMLAALATQAGGCSAHFVDERPLSERDQLDLVYVPPDLRGADLTGVRFGTFAGGPFAGRDGHLGVGGASLFRRDDGGVELRFDALFAVSMVSGPAVVLSSRPSLGNAIDRAQGDSDLGPLSAYSGAQSYTMRDDGGRRFAFVFCVPYGLEVARAVMKDEP